ncbi:PIN domain-like protein [Lactarius quietus]|nr:PIN domain-like protein [Lactarius quietus]
MGVTGLWDILRPSGKLRSLTHIAVVDGFEANPTNLHGIRISINASIWFSHATHGREGENPELRTLFFRCAKLLSSPFLPLFIFDGPKRPMVKRGKRIPGGKHWLVDGVKGIIEAFRFEWRMAPGEAEAELAYLNSIGTIDAVLSDDVDNFLFSAKMVIHNASATLSGNSKHTTKNVDGHIDGNHSIVYTSADILAHPSTQLTQGGLILIALLSGGDCHPAGLLHCGPCIAHGLAKCGFGDQLLKATQSLTAKSSLTFSPHGARTFAGAAHKFIREPRLQEALLAKAVPDSFPDIDTLLFTHCTHTPPQWEHEPDLRKLAQVCELHFEWGLKDIIIKCFRTIIWPGIVLRLLRRSALDSAGPPESSFVPNGKKGEPLLDIINGPVVHETGKYCDSGLQELVVKIHSSRKHANTDNIIEYRLKLHQHSLCILLVWEFKDSKGPLTRHSGDESGRDPNIGDTGRGRKKRGAGPSPEPDSHLRMWMPACMVRPVLPHLVEQYKAEVEAKHTKKSKGRQQAPTSKAQICGGVEGRVAEGQVKWVLRVSKPKQKDAQMTMSGSESRGPRVR